MFPMLCLGARLRGVIICWIVFLSPLTNHLKNTEHVCLDESLPSEMGEIISLDVPHHFTEVEDF